MGLSFTKIWRWRIFLDGNITQIDFELESELEALLDIQMPT